MPIQHVKSGKLPDESQRVEHTKQTIPTVARSRPVFWPLLDQYKKACWSSARTDIFTTIAPRSKSGRSSYAAVSVTELTWQIFSIATNDSRYEEIAEHWTPQVTKQNKVF